MGQTLENGVYLPSEGERNCYAGLKTNWEILDQKVADVTALQQAVAGALHRQIVASLPTTDIDPNTIYMVLSGTSATENVYNEYMYVNNAWELIGTSATDLTNYYTKGEIDGKLLLKANDSDVVHKSGDETVGGKKTFTNDVAVNNPSASVQTDVPNLVFKNPLVERASTTLEGEQTILFTDKNNNNIASIKARSDPSGIISDIILTSYSETSEQSERTTGIVIRRTPTTSKLHGFSDNITTLGETNRRWKSVYAMNYYYGNDNIEFSNKFVTTDTDQTISGKKTFDSNTYVYNSDNTATTPTLILKNSKVSKGSSSETGTQMVRFYDKGDALVGELENVVGNKQTALRYRVSTLDSNNQPLSIYVTLIVSSTGSKLFCPGEDNGISLGGSTLRWSKIYGTEYYYGSNNVEFSTKFVTTDTNQTISGNKTFSNFISSDGNYLGNEASVNQRTNICLRSNRDTANKSCAYISRFRQNKSQGALQTGDLQWIGFDVLENEVRTNNVFSIQCSGWVDNVPTKVKLLSTSSDSTFGSSARPSKINDLEPSSLGMPDLNNGIDISSYITIGDTDNNYYTPPANGWIWIRLIGNGASIHQGDFGSNANYVANSGTSEKWVETCLLVTKDIQATIRCRNITGIIGAKFYPCLGNV